MQSPETLDGSSVGGVTNFLNFVFWMVLAGFGGAVKYISGVIRSNESVSNRRFLLLLAANIFISSFCGMMGLLLVSTFTESLAWYGIAAGMFGYIGTQGLDIVLLALKKKISLTSSSSIVMQGVDTNAEKIAD